MISIHGTEEKKLTAGDILAIAVVPRNPKKRQPKQAVLFPDMEKEIRDDRTAQTRERAQHARAWLVDKDLSWLINYILENGPKTEHVLTMEIMDDDHHLPPESFMNAMVILLLELDALWKVKKLWRKSIGVHVGSGEESFIYGIRGVHEVPAKGDVALASVKLEMPKP